MIKPTLLAELIRFRQQRDWEQFHSPKDLAISLSIEVAELLEWFQWRTNEQIEQQLQTDKRQALEEEIADVAIYLSYLCHDLNLDLDKIVETKMHKNALKYPIDKVKGRADKYTDYT